tara:strand:+ start:1443 stop:1673 length:231 start_codon:yes stop_codon:yes gene_type:complete
MRTIAQQRRLENLVKFLGSIAGTLAVKAVWWALCALIATLAWNYGFSPLFGLPTVLFGPVCVVLMVSAFLVGLVKK